MESVTNQTLEKLKYDLVRDGLVKYEDLERAEEIAHSQNISLGNVLVKSELITEEKLLKFLENKLHIPYVDLKDYTPDIKSLSFISYTEAKTLKIMPLFEIEGELTVAMADPLDLFAIDKIMEKTGLKISPVVSAETSVIKKIEEYYAKDTDIGGININETESRFDWREELQNDILSDEHIQLLISAVLKQAVQDKIREIYFEHTDEGLSVNFETENGTVHSGTIPTVLTVPFISRLKNIASMDANICELPQSGKMVFKVEEMLLTAVISSFPTINGERISLKIYKPPGDLKTAGFTDRQREEILIETGKPGLTLVCGSSLSGKTHIIYSLLAEIAKSGKKRNIMTVESVAKYKLENVNQCELNENIGFNLDKAMRFIEFQSPDVIYFETITTKAALDYFGSLVFKNKTLITEFLADNIDDLNRKLSYGEFEMFRPLISTIVFIHSQNRTELFNRNDLKRFIGLST